MFFVEDEVAVDTSCTTLLSDAILAREKEDVVVDAMF